jgi:hypothetical protein
MPKNCKIVFVFLLLFAAMHGGAQSFEQELKDAVKTKPKLEFRLDSRHSFINQTGVKTAGVKVGIQFDEKLSIGLGYNRLWSPLSRVIVQEGTLTKVDLAFHNLSPYIEYVFFRDNKWELSIPVQFGFGSSYYSNKSNVGANKLRKEIVVSYEPAITFQYRFFKYFGAGIGIGYRFMIVGNEQLEEKFTSPVYIFKTRFYFQDIWKDLNRH